MQYSSSLSKLRSMLAVRSVSSLCVPDSISCLAASCGGSSCCCCSEEEEDEEAAVTPLRFLEGGGWSTKPSLWGSRERRRRSTESRARSARTLTVLMMSSRRDWPSCQLGHVSMDG